MTNTEHFLLDCLGADYEYDLKFADEFAEKFQCDIYKSVDKESLLEGAASDSRFLGINFILGEICATTIAKASEELGLEEDKFDYYINSLDTHLYYDGEEVYSWEELEALAEEESDEE